MANYNYINLLLIVTSSTLQGMALYEDELLINGSSTTFYATSFDEGFGAIQRFFSGRRNSFCSDDETIAPHELLQLILRNPEEEQKEGGLSFEQFRDFYRGVIAALQKVEYDKVPESKVPFIDNLLKTSAEIIQTRSYEDLLAKTRNAQWGNCIIMLEDLLSSCMVIHADEPEMSLNLDVIKVVLQEQNTSILYDLVPILNTALGKGNLAQDDIDELLAIATQLLDIPLESYNLSDEQKHIEYQNTLKSFVHKVITLKKAPNSLYLDTHNQCLYNNDPLLAAKHFTQCLLATQGLTEGQSISQPVMVSFTYVKTFLKGINSGLPFHTRTLGRICSVKKLAAFIKHLPAELELLEHNAKSTSKLNEELLKALRYSPNLIGHLRKLVKDIYQLDRTLLSQ